MTQERAADSIHNTARRNRQRSCEKIVANTPSARRTERSDETYRVDRRGASTAQHSDWSA